MRPIKTKHSNFVYGPPRGMTTDECDNLHCNKTDDGRVISVWQPDETERKMLAEGACIELHVWSQPTPPVGFIVTHHEEVK